VKCGSWLFTRDIPDFPDCVVEGRNLLEALDEISCGLDCIVFHIGMLVG
jgi:hypothetical protein